MSYGHRLWASYVVRGCRGLPISGACLRPSALHRAYIRDACLLGGACLIWCVPASTLDRAPPLHAPAPRAAPSQRSPPPRTPPQMPCARPPEHAATSPVAGPKRGHTNQRELAPVAEPKRGHQTEGANVCGEPQKRPPIRGGYRESGPSSGSGWGAGEARSGGRGRERGLYKKTRRAQWTALPSSSEGARVGHAAEGRSGGQSAGGARVGLGCSLASFASPTACVTSVASASAIAPCTLTFATAASPSSAAAATAAAASAFAFAFAASPSALAAATA
eukprot:341793-Prymnesium_polylepis.1